MSLTLRRNVRNALAVGPVGVWPCPRFVLQVQFADGAEDFRRAFLQGLLTV
jgi:hypothetical protein